MIEFRNFGGPGGRVSNLSSRITMKQFIDACQAQDIFNVMLIRDVAKAKVVIEDANPYINRESVLSRDLFGGRLSEQEINGGGVEEDLTDAPHIFSDAVLYKVVNTIDTQLSQTQRITRREQRQYLAAVEKASMSSKLPRRALNSLLFF